MSKFVSNKNSISYTYNSEVLLLTKTYRLDDLRNWIIWYSEILNFDHIVIYDNESEVDVESLCKEYKKVEYRYVVGFPNQSWLYDNYIRRFCRSKWLIALDDDELLYIGNKYDHDVNTLLKEIEKRGISKLGIEWVYLLSEERIESRDVDESYIDSHVYRIDRNSDLEFNFEHRYDSRKTYVKCFIDREACNWRYAEPVGDKKIISHVHNPIKEKIDEDDREIVFENGREMTKYGYVENDVFNENLFIGHYLYKSRDEWIKKCGLCTISKKSVKLEYMKPCYDEMYSLNRDKFIECDLVRYLFRNRK